MNVQLAAGVSIDLATTDDVKSGTDSILDKLTSGPAAPLRLVQVAQQVGPSTLGLDLGSPPTGRMWEVTSFTVIGSNAFTAIAAPAAVALCIGDPESPSFANVRYPALGIPVYQGVSGDGLWVRSNENLYVLTVSIPAAQQIVVSARINEWRESDITMKNPGYTPYR